ncbi:hypothetical protein [Kitasatospora paranensis]|uniref:Uncharacterized protein n=1 Tax=Kitasatospora paranensis TaxID=258053 RepID=A0ABW2FPA6_9ACTN
MTGTLVVRAEQALMGRARPLGVFVDGVRVAEVVRGGVARITVEPGRHEVRTGRGRLRSNSVAVDVREGAEFVVTAFGTGYEILIAVVPVLGLLGLAPGVVLRLRAEGDDVVPRGPGPEDARDAEQGAGAGGLWWESDPQLAKRYRKSGAS